MNLAPAKCTKITPYTRLVCLKLRAQSLSSVTLAKLVSEVKRMGNTQCLISIGLRKLLRIEWAEKIDIWALGLVIWTMIEGTNLFTDNHGGRWISALPHMARMISLLGHPPQDLLDVTPVTKQYFDKTGRLKKGYTVAETSLEAEAKALEGTEKIEFLRFLRRFLQWRPSERPSAQELLEGPWLTPEPDSEDDS